MISEIRKDGKVVAVIFDRIVFHGQGGITTGFPSHAAAIRCGIAMNGGEVAKLDNDQAAAYWSLFRNVLSANVFV
jgi:hypothetical protein